MANLNIKLVKSLNGRIQKHKANAAALGLKKIGDTTVQPDNPCTTCNCCRKSFFIYIKT